ncbi:MAG: protein kinase [Myxococcales bacterium]|nr:protein kinase [Myxococcales bacterium]
MQPLAEPACPDENALAELVQGLLDAATAAHIEAHLDGCHVCRRTVSSVGQSSYVAHRRTRIDAPRWGDATWVMVGASPTVPASTPVANTSHSAGDILAGKYQIERPLGQGGMGVVLAAKHLALGKLVAIKLMRAELVVDASAAQRFVREARAASCLRSEHIVRVIDLDTLEDGSPYIAMEYLEGEDLGALLQRCGRVGAREAATYVVQVCEALSEAHGAGIVHRDLKPANLFVTRRGDGSPCMKVLDFGVSKIIAGGPFTDELTTTDTKALVGSPHYMAPEQLLSAKAVDPRTDIWALGCILFELVSGRNPFVGTALAQVLASILRDDIPPLRELCPDLPAGFAAVITRCLDKDPARRFQRVDEVSAALEPFVVDSAAPLVLAEPPAVERRSKARRWPLAIASLISILAISGFALIHHRGEPAGTEPPPRGLQTAEPAVSDEGASSTVEPRTEPPPTPASTTPAIDAGVVGDAPAVPRASVPTSKVRPRQKPKLEDDLIPPSL